MRNNTQTVVINMTIKRSLFSNIPFSSLENWSLRRGGCLREAGVRLQEVVAVGGSTVVENLNEHREGSPLGYLQGWPRS